MKLKSILFSLALLYASLCTAAPSSYWIPEVKTRWQWQLTGSIKTSYNVSMYDIDLFDAPQNVIDKLHMEGKKVICYFSAGTWENWRPDAKKFPNSIKGRSNGWPGEKWLDIRNTNELRPIMSARLDLAVSKRCDGVEPDNVDGYANKSGFTLKSQDQLVYNMWLASKAHTKNLSIGLKNDTDQVDILQPAFDFAVVEECVKYKECAMYRPFIKAGKAVFAAEYMTDKTKFCPTLNAENFNGIKKNKNLNAYMDFCR